MSGMQHMVQKSSLIMGTNYQSEITVSLLAYTKMENGLTLSGHAKQSKNLNHLEFNIHMLGITTYDMNHYVDTYVVNMVLETTTP